MLGNCILLRAQCIEIYIQGIRSQAGSLVIGVFESQENFKNDLAVVTKIIDKTLVHKGGVMIKIELDPGTYGLAILDDENDDRKMNYNLLGIPKEGFGFSNYYPGGITRPKFKQFSFSLNENDDKKILVKLRYMN
jgi:uncharacterized protein (DUF2141 family)